MALNPIGAGASVAIAVGAGQTSSAFDVRSNAIRLVAVGSGCHIVVGSEDFTDNATGVQPTISDFYIPSGGVATLQQKKASQIVASVDTGASSTVFYAPEGMQWPFGVGDYVGLSTSNNPDTDVDINWPTIVNYVPVTAVDNGSAGPYGSFSAKLTVTATTNGISTALPTNGQATIIRQNKVCTFGGSDSSAGHLHYQQVQISGEA